MSRDVVPSSEHGGFATLDALLALQCQMWNGATNEKANYNSAAINRAQ